MATRKEPRVFALLILIMSGLTLIGSVAIFVLGRDYYFHPGERLDHADHRLFASTGVIGLWCGIAATVLFLSNLFYLVRKKARLEKLGTMRHWLRWHVVSGILGCLLVALHACFEVRTLVTQVVIWSLVIVIVTGIVGRYLVRFIPRTRDGQQQAIGELEGEILDFIEKVRPAVKGDAEALAVLGRMTDALDDSGDAPGLAAAIRRGRRARQELRYLTRNVPLDLLEDGNDFKPMMRRAGWRYRQLVAARFASNLLDGWRIFHRVLAILFVVGLAFHVGAALYYGFV